MELQPEIDFTRIGQRIKSARLEKGLSQADLGSLVGCSNNHMSHVETGQTKVSLTMLLKIACALDKDMNYFLLDTPYVQSASIINLEIAQKLKQCDASTLISLSRIIDVLLDQQQTSKKQKP